MCIRDRALTKRIFPQQWAPRWHCESFSFADDYVEQVHKLRGKVVVEIQEMAGALKTGMEKIKGFLTTENDSARLKYNQHACDYPRMVILVGTSNYHRCIPPDKTGRVNDRFIPVFLGAGGDVESYMDQHRSQLWAEALNRYTAGERANMTRPQIEGVKCLISEATVRYQGVLPDSSFNRLSSS